MVASQFAGKGLSDRTWDGAPNTWDDAKDALHKTAAWNLNAAGEQARTTKALLTAPQPFLHAVVVCIGDVDDPGGVHRDSLGE